MIARLIPSAQPCGEQAWQDLYLSMNSLPARVVIKRHSLDELVEHHQRLGYRRPDLELEERGNKYYVVDRLKLFAFVNAHGKVCKHDK